MKAEELMKGDWICSIIDRYDHIEKKYVVVTGIRTDTDVPLIQCNDTDVWYSMDSYEPIPLTPEILEKNGFVKKGEMFKHLIYELTLNEDTEDETWVVVKLHPKNEKCNYMWVTITYLPAGQINKNTIETKIVDCSVHQLQHAFKLCGIDKKIKL